MDLQLREHVVVVTGGASGIGYAIAQGFAAEGAGVALWDRSPQVAVAAAEIADRNGVPTKGVSVDVADQASVEAAVRETNLALGPIDHLVHAAAIGSGKFGFPFTNLEPSDWRRSLEVNIMGMVHVAHAVAPAMIERKSGTMVFIASVAGQIGSQTDPPYSATKAANINFAQCLAKDLAGSGIRVNSVCPGMVQTPLNKGVWQAWNNLQPADKRQTYEEWAGDKVRQIVPLGRWQQPADIADMVVFLSSTRAMQVTGQTINVDGGYVMHW
ncbi:MAG: SDR family oxidoreductase [Planctomycetaceae bacterium]|nr:SDR family oxidoreductase [Planctomycetaceae bacterium]